MSENDNSAGDTPVRPAGWWTPFRWRSLLVAGLLLHALVAVGTPLSGDETYYWDCSRHLDWSYFDQPPLVIWLMVPFRLLFGDTALAVRGPALLASLLIGVFMLRLARRLGGGEREAAQVYLLLHATPLFLLGSSYVSTDVMMIATYVGATWAAVAVAQGDRRAWWGFGIFSGLGFLAKFPMIAILAVLVPLLAQSSVREQLRTATPYLAGGLSLLLTAPVWIWGAQHNWENITFQTGRVPDTAWITYKFVLEFIAANLALATPFLGIAMGIAWWIARRRLDPGWLVYRVATAAPLIGFGLVSLRGRVAAHWGAPGLVLAALILIFIRFRGWRNWVIAGVVSGLLVSSTAIAVATFPVEFMELGRSRPELGQRLRTHKLAAVVGNRETAERVAQIWRPGELVASESYTMVHYLAYFTGGELPARLGNVNRGSHGLASLYWYGPEEFAGQQFLFVTDLQRVEPRLLASFEEVVRLPSLRIERGGWTVREVHLFRCRNPRSTAQFSRLAPESNRPR